MTVKKPLSLDHVHVILVRPTDPRNIGFACRAMKTMGITRLRIVSSKPVNLSRAAMTAVHASDLLSPQALFGTIKDAVRDMALVAGITRRRGKMRKYVSYPPEDLAARALGIKQGKVALVFGNEEYGLTDEELALCHCAVHIPSSPLFPSLNLSHAVQIICYALFRASLSAPAPLLTPINYQSLEILVSTIIAYLQPLRYFKLQEAKSLSVFLKDILGRAGLSKSEVKRLETMFHKINGIFIRDSKKKATPPWGTD